MRGLVFGLARGAARPQRMLLRALEHLVDAQRAGGNRPCVFFIPERSALRRRKSIGSMFSCAAISSTAISVAAMLCSVP